VSTSEGAEASPRRKPAGGRVQQQEPSLAAEQLYLAPLPPVASASAMEKLDPTRSNTNRRSSGGGATRIKGPPAAEQHESRALRQRSSTNRASAGADTVVAIRIRCC
jgi:hypothetical protein